MPYELRSVVDEAFAIVAPDHRRWARDWLLSWDCDPAGDVTALSNPAAVASATTSILTAVCAPLPGLDCPFSFGAKAVYTWLPSWTQAGVTVGMTVEHVADTPGLEPLPYFPTTGEPAIRTIGRFVREEATGETVLLANASQPVAGRPRLCCLVHLRNDTSTLRKHSFLLCDYNVLCRRVKDPGGFADAALLGESSMAVRQGGCPVCWKDAQAGPPCDCSLPLVVPTSPLDFSKFSLNSVANNANFHGLSTFFLRIPDVNGSPSTLQTMHRATSFHGRSAKEVGEEAFARSLQALALQDRVTEASPFRLILPRASAESFASAEKTSATATGDQDLQNPLLGLEEDRTSTGGALSAQGGNSGDNLAVPQGDGKSGSTVPGNSDFLFSEVPADDLTENAPLAALEPLFPDIPAFDVSSDIFELPIPPDAFGMTRLGDEEYPVDETFATAEPETRGVESTVDSTSAPTEQQDEATTMSPEEAAKEARKIERQRKNRLAASRSNARRKHHRETLEKSLREIRTRKQALERKEAELRSYNIQLKDLAAGLWINGVKRGSCEESLES